MGAVLALSGPWEPLLQVHVLWVFPFAQEKPGELQANETSAPSKQSPPEFANQGKWMTNWKICQQDVGQ